MPRRVAPARAERVPGEQRRPVADGVITQPAKWNPPGLDNDQEDGGPTIQLPAAEPAAPFVPRAGISIRVERTTSHATGGISAGFII
jgi:hypothetical protein